MIASLIQLVTHSLLIYPFRSEVPRELSCPARVTKTIRASATCLLITTCACAMQSTIFRLDPLEVRYWFFLDAYCVTLGCWLIIPSLAALSFTRLFGPGASFQGATILPYHSPKSGQLPSIARFALPSWRPKVRRYFYRLKSDLNTSALLLCLLFTLGFTAVLSGVGLWLNIPKLSFTIGNMFQRFTVVGNVISASLYGMGTVNGPLELLSKSVKRDVDFKKQELLDRINLMDSDLREGSMEYAETYADILADLKQDYNELCDQTKSDTLRHIYKWVGCIMVLVGLYRLVSTGMSLLEREAQPGVLVDDNYDLVKKALQIVRFPGDIVVATHLISFVYVSILVGHSLTCFQRFVRDSLASWRRKGGITARMSLLPDITKTLLHCFYCASSLIIFRPAFHVSSQELVVDFVGENLGRFHTHFNGVFVISTLFTTFVRLL